MRLLLFFLILLIKDCEAQFGEIASLATSLLGGALGGGSGLGALAGAGASGAGAAAQAGGALAQIGQLYQLAQGALQLTGTGVGVLNQASEGNWFPAVLEQTAKGSQVLMKGGGPNLGALGPSPDRTGSLGPEFGTSFPAPNVEDYDENTEIPGFEKDKKSPKPPDGLVDIDSGDYELETTTAPEVITTSTEEIATLFPEEETSIEPKPTKTPSRQIRIQLPDKNGSSKIEEDRDYEDLIKKNSNNIETSNNLKTVSIEAESTDELKNNVITHGTKTQPVVPNLNKLVEVLQKSKLSKEEIHEIVSQVKGNGNIEKSPKYDVNSSVQNINDKRNTLRQKITNASRALTENLEHGPQNQKVSQKVNERRAISEVINTQKSNNLSAKNVAPTIVSPQLPLQQKSNAAPAPVQSVFSNTFSQPTPINAYRNGYQPQQQQLYYSQQAQPYFPQQPNYNQQQQPNPSQGFYQGQLYQYYYTTPTPYNYYQSYQYRPQNVQQPQELAQQLQQNQNIQNQPNYYGFTGQQNVALSSKTVTETLHFLQTTTPSLKTVQTVQSNSNQIIHYYKDGNRIIRQLIPRKIAATGIFPLDGPFKPSGTDVKPNFVEYQKRQETLKKAYLHPQLSKKVSTSAKRQISYKSDQPPHPVQKRIFESTVTANAQNQAHAIRTYQVSNTKSSSKKNSQPASPVRNSSRTRRVEKKTGTGPVLSTLKIDNRSLIERRTTAKPPVNPH